MRPGKRMPEKEKRKREEKKKKKKKEERNNKQTRIPMQNKDQIEKRSDQITIATCNEIDRISRNDETRSE